MAGIPGLEALRLALFPISGASEAQGPFQLLISGTVNTIGGGTGGTAVVDESAYTTGGTSLTPMGGVNLGLGAQAAASIATGVVAAPRISPQRVMYAALATPSGGDAMDNANSALRVNVVAGGAGGGVANLTVRGSGNQDIHVGYVGGGSVNSDGGAYVPIQGSVNIGGVTGSVNVTQGTLPLPITGSVTLGAVATVNLGLGTVNIGNTIALNAIATVNVGTLPFPVFGQGGSLGVTQITSPWVVVGSVNITGSINPVGIFGSVNVLGTTTLGAIATVNLGLGTVNIGNGIVGSVFTTPQGVQVVDTRASLVATSWSIAGAATGQILIAGTAPANQRIFLSSFHVVCDGTADFQWLSPSGIAISGSMRLLPGAGFAMAGGLINSPVVIGSQNSALYARALGTLNLGGFAVGWVA